MPIRLAAFDLDGTLIRGRNALAVISAALRRPEWEEQMEILYMRGAAPEEMKKRDVTTAIVSPCSGPRTKGRGSND